MNSPSSQISLKSTSSISLHDRFTNMQMLNQPELTDFSTNMQPVQTASVKNQWLAQQMANRPSVLAALRNKHSLKQRLGKQSIKARLSRPLMRGGLRGMTRHRGRTRRGAFLRGAFSLRFTRGRQGAVSASVTHQGLNHQQRGAPIMRPGMMLNRGVRGPSRGTGLPARGRGACVGGGWSRGRRWVESRPVPTREELDEQLDDYMSMTKSHLDAQLDAYMAEVDTEDLHII